MARKDEFNTPGPSSYDVKTKPFKGKVEHPTANFVSSTVREVIVEVNLLFDDRFHFSLLFFSSIKDIPGPTAYDVSHAYQALTSQHRQPPRSKNARKRHSQFLSAAKRTFAGDASVDTPGPGAYDGFVNERARGVAPVRDTRFRYETSKLPGPADYELSPLLQDTVLRGTFNTTLNNPVLAKLQNRALREEKSAAAALNSASTIPPMGGLGDIGDVPVHT